MEKWSIEWKRALGTWELNWICRYELAFKGFLNWRKGLAFLMVLEGHTWSMKIVSTQPSFGVRWLRGKSLAFLMVFEGHTWNMKIVSTQPSFGVRWSRGKGLAFLMLFEGHTWNVKIVSTQPSFGVRWLRGKGLAFLMLFEGHTWPRGGGVLGSGFAGYVPLASQNPHPFIVYSVAN